MISVVIPAYNEEDNVERCAVVTGGILRDAGIDYELIFVDDGSADGTWAAIERASAADGRVRGVSFSRNFGKDRAIFAGLSKSCGDCAAVMDCDLQHPPDKLPEMYRLWEQGWEVVEGVKLSRGRESVFHRLAAGTFYRVISSMAKLDMRRSSDFKLLDRKVVDALESFGEEEVFFRGLSTYVGFKTTRLEFSVAERTAGESKWSFKSLSRYAISSVTSFSTAPLRLPMISGVICLLLAVVLGSILAVTGPGPAWTAAIQFILLAAAGVLLLSLGVMGYYLGRIYRQNLGRPRYIISRECGWDR